MVIDVPLVMGIVNVTPDSFSDGGRFLEAGAAIAHGRELRSGGADILDVGGESTRPGAAAVDAAEERARVIPVIEALAAEGGGGRISIDTSKASVAAAALSAGAEIVNDVTAFSDPEMAEVCASTRCDVILMHMRGTPRTMQDDPVYEDVVDEVCRYLSECLEIATGRGVEEESIWLDPGIGFGKTIEHNLALISGLGRLVALGRPVVVGASRKNFIGAITGRDVGERLGGSIAAGVLALANGATVLRVHDVAETIEAITVAEQILGSRERRSFAPVAG